MNYAEAKDILAAGRTARSRQSRKLENNTYLEARDEGAIAIRLHATDVVTFYPDGIIELNTGGWYSMTTKTRMNAYIPAGVVFSERGDWRIGTSWSDKGAEPYFDGIRLDEAGKALNSRRKEMADRERERNVMRKRIKVYCQTIRESMQESIPIPSNGDCWFCSMRDADSDTALGDMTGDNGHLLSHLDESYVVPSLIVNAVLEKGYQYPAVVLRAYSDKKTMGGDYYSAQIASRAVRSYLNKRLIPDAATT